MCKTVVLKYPEAIIANVELNINYFQQGKDNFRTRCMR